MKPVCDMELVLHIGKEGREGQKIIWSRPLISGREREGQKKKETELALDMKNKEGRTRGGVLGRKKKPPFKRS